MALLGGNLRKWKNGRLSRTLSVEGREVTLHAERQDHTDSETHEIRFSWDNEGITFASLLEAFGELPIPPYLNRATEESDKETYQTVYSHVEGSVAAPTAGLHFTPEVFAALQEKGIPRLELTLHVGAGTFKPVKAKPSPDMRCIPSISRSPERHCRLLPPRPDASLP